MGTASRSALGGLGGANVSAVGGHGNVAAIVNGIIAAEGYRTAATGSLAAGGASGQSGEVQEDSWKPSARLQQEIEAVQRRLDETASRDRMLLQQALDKAAEKAAEKAAREAAQQSAAPLEQAGWNAEGNRHASTREEASAFLDSLSSECCMPDAKLSKVLQPAAWLCTLCTHLQVGALANG